MNDQLIGDIRAVNMWDYVDPPWDGVTLPRPKKELVVTHFEIQIRKIIVNSDNVPVLTDWMPINVVDYGLEGKVK